MKTGRYIVILNRATVPTKIHSVLIVTVLPLCSTGLIPGSTTMTPLCRPVCPGFTTIKPGFTPVVYASVAVAAGHATAMPRCLSVVKMISTGVDWDKTGFTVAKSLQLFYPDGIPVHRGGDPVKPRFLPEKPGVVLVTHGLLYAGSSQFIKAEPWWYHGLSRCRSGFPRFDISPCSPRLY